MGRIGEMDRMGLIGEMVRIDAYDGMYRWMVGNGSTGSKGMD